MWTQIVELWTLAQALPWLREYRFRRYVDKDNYGTIEIYPVEDWKHNMKERWSKGLPGFDPSFLVFREDGKYYLVNNFASYDSETGVYSEKEHGPYRSIAEAVIEVFLEERLRDQRERLWERKFYREVLRTHKGQIVPTAELDALVAVSSLPLPEEEQQKIAAFFVEVLDIVKESNHGPAEELCSVCGRPSLDPVRRHAGVVTCRGCFKVDYTDFPPF